MIFLKIFIIICLRFICLYILQTYFNCITTCTLWTFVWNKLILSYIYNIYMYVLKAWTYLGTGLKIYIIIIKYYRKKLFLDIPNVFPPPPPNLWIYCEICIENYGHQQGGLFPTFFSLYGGGLFFSMWGLRSLLVLIGTKAYICLYI